MVPIEQIRAGQQVHSRHDRLFSDAAQTVTQVFARTAPGYRVLSTEFDQFKLTDEHPLWVQGKGWTQAQYITDDDVIAGAHGDALVLGNEPVQQPLLVYNFSVAKTANYFVGEGATWAHNAYCELPHYKAPKSPSGYKIGASDGGQGKWTRVNRPNRPHFKYEKQITGAPKDVEYQVNGVNFDGYDATRKVLLEATNYSADNPLIKKGAPDFLVREFQEQALKQAQDQRQAAGKDPIEWHVANKEVAEELRALLDKADENPDIKIIFTPNFQN